MVTAALHFLTTEREQVCFPRYQEGTLRHCSRHYPQGWSLLIQTEYQYDGIEGLGVQLVLLMCSTQFSKS